MTRREMIIEWMKGCSNTYTCWRPWWFCGYCFAAFTKVFLFRAIKDTDTAFMAWRRM